MPKKKSLYYLGENGTRLLVRVSFLFSFRRKERLEALHKFNRGLKGEPANLSGEPAKT